MMMMINAYTESARSFIYWARTPIANDHPVISRAGEWDAAAGHDASIFRAKARCGQGLPSLVSDYSHTTMIEGRVVEIRKTRGHTLVVHITTLGVYWDKAIRLPAGLVECLLANGLRPIKIQLWGDRQLRTRKGIRPDWARVLLENNDILETVVVKS